MVSLTIAPFKEGEASNLLKKKNENSIYLLSLTLTPLPTPHSESKWAELSAPPPTYDHQTKTQQ